MELSTAAKVQYLETELGVSNTTEDMRYEPFQFVNTNPVLGVALLIVLVVASVVGSGGNILILVAVATHHQLRKMESIFIVNLACCDLYVTLVVDPLSIVGKTIGWRWYEERPYLCRVVGSLCTVSCVGSLMTLSAMSCNRYVLICHHSLYRRIFTRCHCVLILLAIYLVGTLLVVLNFGGLGDHSFDHKSLECIWDRMDNHDYTIVFAVVMVWVPITVTGFAYCRIYQHVKKSRKRVHYHTNTSSKNSSTLDYRSETLNGDVSTTDKEAGGKPLVDSVNDARWKRRVEKLPLTSRDEDGSSAGAEHLKGESLPTKSATGVGGVATFVFDDAPSQQSLVMTTAPTSANNVRNRVKRRDCTTVNVARALFSLYLVFAVCWVPYSLLIILDRKDTFAHELHVTIVVWAHLHPSINWLMYYKTHSKFRRAFRKLLGLDKCCGSTQRA